MTKDEKAKRARDVQRYCQAVRSMELDSERELQKQLDLNKEAERLMEQVRVNSKSGEGEASASVGRKEEHQPATCAVP